METPDIRYGFKKAVSLPLEEADARLREELKKERFGNRIIPSAKDCS